MIKIAPRRRQETAYLKASQRNEEEDLLRIGKSKEAVKFMFYVFKYLLLYYLVWSYPSLSKSGIASNTDLGDSVDRGFSAI